jgi:hypothetical protein
MVHPSGGLAVYDELRYVRKACCAIARAAVTKGIEPVEVPVNIKNK